MTKNYLTNQRFTEFDLSEPLTRGLEEAGFESVPSPTNPGPDGDAYFSGQVCWWLSYLSMVFMLPWQFQAKAVGGNESHMVRVKAASDPGNRSADSEGDQFVVCDWDANDF